MPRVINIVKKGLYRDSVYLLHIGEELRKVSGVIDAFIAMGTRLNKDLMLREGFLTSDGEDAGENDLIVALKLGEDADIDNISRLVEELLTQHGARGLEVYEDLDLALNINRDINLALVSIPGRYAREVVMKLLERGVHVHLFSDHVPIEDEVAMKRYAYEKGLLLMGPEAGTSIIGGVAIAFANAVRRGSVGVISASGTGLQEVSVLLHRIGLGVSHGIGVGGRDLSREVGGLMTLFSIDVFENDPGTSIVTIVSKPPSREIQHMIFDYIASRGRKSYVTCLVGGEIEPLDPEASKRIVQTRTLHAAVLEAARITDPSLYSEAQKVLSIDGKTIKAIEDAIAGLREGQRYIRGLFTGGTFAYEAMVVLGRFVGDIWSNSPLRDDLRLRDPWKSYGNTVIDLGGEEFTEGRAHPMIDPSIRLKRIVDEARDPEVAVIMLDFVLGYGAHRDPAGAHVDAIKRAMEIAREDGRRIAFLAHVVGTDQDPQDLASQERILRELGVIILPTNATMALAAAMISLRRSDMDLIDMFSREFLRGF
ncbi:MAG: hypothetical protein QXI22_05975 [Sulfolobales archaeon]